MVAGGGDPGLTTPFGPDSTELGMEGKAALVGKDQKRLVLLI